MPNAPLNLTVLNDEQFEDLIEAIFRAKAPPLPANDVGVAESTSYTVVSVSRSGRGHDEGRDLLITTIVRDCVAPRFIRWVVQCKHKALSGKSVGPGDFDNDFSFPDVVSHHNANGYLLVCSTRPSTRLQARLDKLTSDNNAQQYVAWDYARVCEEVFKHESVMRQFFPEEYRRQQKLVEGSRVEEWARQFDGEISEDALAALSDIVDLHEPLRAEETDKGEQ